VQHRLLRAAAALAVIGLVAACEAPTPTPVNGAAPDAAAPGPDASQQPPAATHDAHRIVVEPGQSVSRIAAKYGVAKRAIIAANNLTPPYKIKIGQSLLIPGTEGPLPAPAVAVSSGSEIIPLDPLALPGSSAPPPAAAPLAAATASPAPPPDFPAVKPFEAAAPALATTGGPPASSDGAQPPATATTAAAAPPAPVSAAAPPGVICPFGTTGAWSEDIIKKPVYVCRRPS
jgi:LysM repeat protein